MKMKIISVFVVVFILLGASVVLACYKSSDCGRLKTCVGGSSPKPKYDPIYDDCGGSSGSCFFGTCKDYTAPVEEVLGTCSLDSSPCKGSCDDYCTERDDVCVGEWKDQTCKDYTAPVEEVLGTCSLDGSSCKGSCDDYCDEYDSDGYCLYEVSQDCEDYTAPVEEVLGTCSGNDYTCAGSCDKFCTNWHYNVCINKKSQDCEGYTAPVEEVLGTCSEPSGFKQNGYTKGVKGVCVNKANEIIDWFKGDGFRLTWRNRRPGIRYKKTF